MTWWNRLRPSRSIVLVGVLLVALLTVGARAPRSVSAAASPTARLVAVQPCRLADTREPGGFQRLDANTIRITAGGRCGIDASATAVSLSLAAVSAPASGFVTVYPSGIPRPLASNLNYAAGQIRANAAVVQVGAGASFDVFTTGGDVVVDITGYFAPAASATSGRFVSATPRRLLDTRDTSLVPAGGTVTLPLPAGVPADAVALALNITVTESVGAGFVTSYPAGTGRPVASSLNLDAAGQTRAAGGIYPVSPGGVTLFLSGGGHVVVDYAGYFGGASSSSSTAGLFVADAPLRLLDTRTAGARLAAGASIGLPSSIAGTAVLNLTSVNGDAGFVSAFAAGADRPLVSNLNPAGNGDIVANFAAVTASAAGFTFFTSSATDLVVDVFGWFTSAASLPPVPTTSPATTTTTTPKTTTTTTVPKTTTTTTTTTTTIPVNNRPVVYLTFDDGPGPYTPQLLAVLAKYNVKATFFMIGLQARIYPTYAHDLYAAGHAIGNHTDTHQNLTAIPIAQAEAELTAAGNSIQAATGHRPTCMRPPTGAMNAATTALVAQLGLTLEQGTIDGGDWVDPQPSVAQLEAVLDTAVNNSILVFHDAGGNRANTVAAFDDWLSRNATNFNFKTLASCH